MVPPSEKLSYYFTANDKIIVASDQEIEESKLIIDENWITEWNVQYDVPQKTIIYTKEIFSKMKWIPRPPPKALAKKERLKTPWDFFKSVFKGKCSSNK